MLHIYSDKFYSCQQLTSCHMKKNVEDGQCLRAKIRLFMFVITLPKKLLVLLP